MMRIGDNLPFVVVPWTKTMRPGGGYNYQRAQPAGVVVVDPSTTYESTGDFSHTEFFVGYSDGTNYTKSSLSASLDLTLKSLMATVKVGGNIGQYSETLNEDATLGISYYVETPTYSYKFSPKLVNGIKLYSEIIGFEQLRREFVDLKKRGKLESFFKDHGTHVIVGWQKAYAVRIDAEAHNVVDKSGSRLGIYADASYKALSMNSRLDRATDTIKKSRSFTFKYSSENTSAAKLPSLPRTIEELTSSTYVEAIRQFLLGIASEDQEHRLVSYVEKSAEFSTEPYKRAGRILAICVPFTAFFELSDDQDIPDEASGLQRAMFNDWFRLDGLVQLLHSLQSHAGEIDFISPAQKALIAPAIDQSLSRKAQLVEWLTKLASNPVPAEVVKIERDYYRLSPIVSPALPTLRLHDQMFAWNDSWGIYVGLKVPKSQPTPRQFSIRTSLADESGTGFFEHDVLGTSDNGRLWYIKNWGDWEDSEDARTVNACIRQYSGNADLFVGTYRIDLIWKPKDLVISTVYVKYYGVGKP